MENKDNNVEENWRQVVEEFGSDDESAAQQAPQQQYAQTQQAPQQYAQGQQIPQQQYAGQQIPQQQYAGQQIPQQQYAGQQIPQQQYAGQQIPQQQYAQAQQYAQQPYGMPSYEASSFAVMPIKKKSKAPIIILIIILVAALICGGIFLFFHFFKGNSSYEKMERGFFAKVSDTIENNPITEVVPADRGQQFEVKVDIGNGEYAPSVLTGNIFASKDGDGQIQAQLKAGDESYLTVNMWRENGVMILQIPELSEMYITNSPLSELDSSQLSAPLLSSSLLMSNSLPSGGMSSIFGLSSLFSSLDNETAEKLLNMVVDDYFEVFSGEDTKAATLTVGSKTINCQSTKISFTNEKMMKLVIALIDDIKNDNTLLSMFEEAGFGKESLNMLKSAFESYLEQSDKEDLEKKLGEMTVYYTDKEIIGRDVYIDNTNVLSMVHVFGDDGISVKFASGDSFDFYMNADKTGENAYNVTSALNMDGSNVFEQSGSFSYTDTSFSGSTDVTCQGQTFTVELNASKESEKTAFDMKISSNGSNVMSVALAAEPTQYQAPDLPKADSTNTFSSSDMSSAEGQAAYSKIMSDIQTNMSNIVEKIQKLPSTDFISDYMAKAFESANSTDDDYDYDYSDNDYDFDDNYNYFDDDYNGANSPVFDI